MRRTLILFVLLSLMQILTTGLASRGWNSGAFKRRLMRNHLEEEEERGFGSILPIRFCDVSHVETILNIFTRRSLRSQTQGDDGNNFFSFFLPDELKRSDWRFLFTSVHFFYYSSFVRFILIILNN